jgi:glycerophosphoryl diester phosphodiesterase
MKPSQPVILGHRGAPRVAPENTLESFHACLKMGAAGFEFDVRQSRDGRLVIAHDARVRGRAISRTAAAALGLPALEEVLARFDHAWLDIEIKTPGIERPVVELVQALPANSHVVTSFRAGTVREVKRLSPATPAGLLFKRRFFRWPAWARHPQLDYLAPHYSCLNAHLAHEARVRGLKLIVWTVNTEAQMRRCRALGVEVVISDEPDRWL